MRGLVYIKNEIDFRINSVVYCPRPAKQLINPRNVKSIKKASL